jgi:hypothetical protein
VDIGAPANAIEYHPALLAHADENAGGSDANNVMPVRPSTVKVPFPANIEANAASDIDSSDLSDDDLFSEDSLGSDESDPEALASMSPGEKAEIEKFGDEYQGPAMSDESSSRLLLLMLHASTCPCRYVCVRAKVVLIFGRKCHQQ